MTNAAEWIRVNHLAAGTLLIPVGSMWTWRGVREAKRNGYLRGVIRTSKRSRRIEWTCEHNHGRDRPAAKACAEVRLKELKEEVRL